MRRASANVESIAIMPWGGIGDVLLLTPALRAVKATHPKATLKVFCIDPLHFQVLQHNPHIDRLKLVPRAWNLKSLRWPVVFWHRFGNLVWGPKRQGRRRFYAPVYGLLHPSLRVNKHATELIAELLDVNLTDRKLEVCLTKDEEAKARTLLRDYKSPVAIHLTSNCYASQNWPIGYWDALVKRNPQHTFVQLGLATEAGVTGAVDLRGKLTLRESFAVLKFARAFIGVVSSLAHAANAFSTPGVVLFGASAPEVWSHPNNAAITKRYRCAPCVDYMCNMGVVCPYGAPCMSDISVKDVEECLEQQLARCRLRP